MGTLTLTRPSLGMREAILDYKREFIAMGETNINGSCGLMRTADFDAWLENALALESERLNREGVHATTYFSVRTSDGRIMGSIQLRHSLTPPLLLHGGNIGYAVRPTERGRGWGHAQLALVLDEARALGLTEVLLDCDRANTASARTMMSCGGVFHKASVFEGVEQTSYIIKL